MRVTKRPLTLIEVCISMGLMAIIVYILFSCLIQTVKLATSLQEIKTKTLQTSFFYTRLLPIFSKADPNSFDFKKEEDGTISQISFTFENGLDPTLMFSGTTNASIYSDHHHNFILDIFSKDQSFVQTEALLNHVKEFSWEEHIPFFLSLELTFTDETKREFVFFFSDRPEKSEGFPI